MISKELYSELVLYASGAMQGEQRSTFEAQLAEDAELRAELEFLRSLHAGIRNEQANPPGEFGLARLKRAIHAEQRPAGRNWWRPVAIAASLLLVVQSALFITRVQQETVYKPLGGDVSEATLQIMFSPSATEAQIRELLRSADAVLVDGPGAGGLYRIRLSIPAESSGYASAIEAIRARKDIITYLAEE
jgi:hypothetical protein